MFYAFQQAHFGKHISRIDVCRWTHCINMHTTVSVRTALHQSMMHSKLHVSVVCHLRWVASSSRLRMASWRRLASSAAFCCSSSCFACMRYVAAFRLPQHSAPSLTMPLRHALSETNPTVLHFASSSFACLLVVITL